MWTTEYQIWKVIIRNKPVHMLQLYHPPANAKDKATNNVFIDNIMELLTEKISKLDKLIIMRDSNIHVEDHSNMKAITFNDTMQAPGLQQHVNKPMHCKGIYS